MSDVEVYEAKLKEWFTEHRKVLVGLSGGVDSCLVAFLARKFNGKDSAVALIGVSPSLKKSDLELAIHFCKTHDITYREITPSEMDNSQYTSNPVNRCYYCKSELYKEMLEERDTYFQGFEILNGNNYSDRNDYRPGMQAATEYDALSPLADCGITKSTIRALAAKFDLEVWDKPASPCMSSRFPYGEEITEEKLSMVEKAEEMIYSMGFSDVRVRYLKTIARIEVPSEEVEKLKEMELQVQEQFGLIGFQTIEIDEEGLVSGKLNRGIITEE